MTKREKKKKKKETSEKEQDKQRVGWTGREREKTGSREQAVTSDLSFKAHLFRKEKCRWALLAPAYLAPPGGNLS